VLAPELFADASRQGRVVGDQVHLGVVEQRVLVEVRGADAEPAVVDDADLRVDVNLLGVPGLIERAREQTLVAVRVGEHAELAARVVLAVVRLARKQDDQAELVAGRILELRLEDRHELGGPEELRLEVDQPLRGAQRADVRLENPEVTARQGVVDAVRDGADELRAHCTLC